MADKLQRQINKWVRVQNRALAKDKFLGPGRFSVRQVVRYGRDPYERVYLFEFRDNLTGQTDMVWANNYNIRQRVYWGINDFIIDIRNKEGW